MSADSGRDLKKTPLFELHVALGAKMVPFAGYEMPVQYPLGIMKEHLHTRDAAGLFDVSHMGQAWLIGEAAEGTPVAVVRIVDQDKRHIRPVFLIQTAVLHLAIERIAHLVVAVTVRNSILDPAFNTCGRHKR